MTLVSLQAPSLIASRFSLNKQFVKSITFRKIQLASFRSNGTANRTNIQPLIQPEESWSGSV